MKIELLFTATCLLNLSQVKNVWRKIPKKAFIYI
nr:MAG TPA: hypothetical protein [Bacteriophage sp.]